MGETALYEPLKLFLTRSGFTVRGEVNDCDLVAMRGDVIVIVEMKRRMNLTLVLQGIDRKSMTDQVYLAIAAPKRLRRRRWSQTKRLCRMLGLGLITVADRRPHRVEVHCEPAPYTPPKNARRTAGLKKEFLARSGDFNVGGSTGRRLITAYREEALRIAQYLTAHGPSRLRDIRAHTALPDTPSKAASIVQKNYYGWFQRVSRGVYQLTPDGIQALQKYAAIVQDVSEAGPPDQANDQ